MIVKKILGNTNDEKFKDLQEDIVDIDWFETRKRILNLHSHSGINIGVRLEKEEQEKGLRQGDVLHIEDGKKIVVNIKEDDAVVVELPNNLHDAVKLAYELGNRHTPLFFTMDMKNLVFPYDFPLMDMVIKMGYKAEKKKEKIHNEKAVSSFIDSEHGHDFGYDGEGGYTDTFFDGKEGHTHSHGGHTHTHSHGGHTHSHDGHTHSHDEHTHSHDHGQGDVHMHDHLHVHTDSSGSVHEHSHLHEHEHSHGEGHEHTHSHDHEHDNY